MPTHQPAPLDGPHVVVIIGPSGSGKSSAVRELHRRGLVAVRPTWTTRPRRSEEGHGSLEHRFVSDEAFDALSRRGFFVDTVAMFGLPFRYGLPATSAAVHDEIEVVMLRAPLVERFARFVPSFVVYQIADSVERTHERLLARGCDRAELAARLADNERELVAGHQLAHRSFVNDRSIGELADDIAAALSPDTVAVAA